MNLRRSLVLIATASALPVLSALADDGLKAIGRVEVELSEVERLNLLASTQVFMKEPVSDILAYALAEGTVARVRADRAIDWEPPVIQGWIYYEKIGGVRPIALCLSQSGPIIDWMWCQDHTEIIDEQRP